MVGMGLISRRWVQRILRGLCVLVLLAASSAAMASAYQGLVTSGGLPVPGATVTVTQGSKKFVAVTDLQGFFSFPTLADGAGTIQVTMTGFAPSKQELTIAPNAAMGEVDLTQLSLDQIRSTLKPVLSAGIAVAQAKSELKKTGAAPKSSEEQASPPPSDETAERAKDGLLINGSVNNAATSQFTLAQRFGNTASGRSLYNFTVNLKLSNSALDAKSYSLTGVDTSKPQTSQITGGFALEGPLKIPHLLRNGPNLFVGYQRRQDSIAVTTPGLMPDEAERNGDFSQKVNAQGQPITIYNPATGQPYPGNRIPINPQAQTLLKLYPLPNFAGNAQYNYQVPLITDTHQDALISNVSKTVGRKDQITGSFAATSMRDSSTNLLGFVDATNELGMASKINWSHTFNARLRMNLGYQFSRQSTRLTPYWQNRTNISGEAGITGNDQEPTYWGPPTLNFSSGLTSLTDGQSSFIRNVTNGVSYIIRWNHWSSHNLSGGVDFKREQFNYLSQANPRGTFTFTGAATAGAAAGSGSDVADFLLGIPDTSALAFGNADKYLRQSVYDAYLNDDWRVTPQLTIDAGVRWEYGAPVTELKGRLVNLDVATGFSAVAPVLATDPKGTLTGQRYPRSLMRPDSNGVEPRIGVSWRPIPGSSMVIRAGYGITHDTSVYEGIALQMAQQAPLSKSLTVQNSAACPLTLANGFDLCPETTAQVFGVDPNYRVGYVHTWNLMVQRDLPGSLQMVVKYVGIKGTRGAQEFLPNTNPAGAVNPCPDCPSGFEYLVSNGNSTRQSGQIQLRRRLRSGFTASVVYTFSKSIDDDSALGGEGAATKASATIAQDWRNLRGERGLSTFDQRHLVKAQVQYTTGMGMGGGTLMSGWRGRLYKEWTVQTQIAAGSGLPQTPLYSVIPIAGYPGIVRPDVTGAPLYDGPANRFLNPAAFTAPQPGQWGNARRNSIIGPSQFSLDASMTRTFRLRSKVNLDLQMAATNALNHVTYSGWIPNINSTQFGLPSEANSMRSLQIALRLRF
jgi:carboxypeptidase family protein/TonB-dependent receptor-like protein